MEPFSAATRTANLHRLAQDRFDVLVIGGGITGAGVALDAAARGYHVGLVERGDFASGTSSKSTKLVHGGIRYLPQFDFALVHEALVERGILRQNAPFLVEPLTFVLPLYEDAQRPVGVPFRLPGGRGLGLTLDAGLWMYDLMAARRKIGWHRRISNQQALRLTPKLHQKGLKEAFLYSDAQTNDTRLTLTVLRSASQHGAILVNYAEVIGFASENDHLTGVQVRDTLIGDSFGISARHIVNAAGIFSERVTSLTGHDSKVTIEPSKGVHLIVARERVGVTDTAIVLPETEDGRILFIVPWGARAIIGTTDTGTGDLDDPEATPADIAYLIRHVNRFLDVQLTEADVLSVYAGYRPLVRSKAAGTANLSRTHVVVQEANGLVTIVGGKLTTYRRMAQDAVDVLAKRDGMVRSHPTERLTLSGGVGWLQAQRAIEARARSLGISPWAVRHLTFNFGRNTEFLLDLIAEDASLGEPLISDLPYLRAEVVYACRYEMAMKLEDVLARRTRIILEDGDRGERIAAQVATLMGRELGWTPSRCRTEEEQYVSTVAHHLATEGLSLR